jgi:alpha-galactosidase
MVIGTQHYHADPLNEPESYTHFGLWSITSSPLVLSLDLNNQTAMDLAWPIISNKEAIAVNQLWAGEAGNVFAQANTTVSFGPYDKGVPTWQYLSKAQGQGRVAVLLVNHGNGSTDLSFEFDAVPNLACAHASSCAVRDIWAQKDMGTFKGSFTANKLLPHGSAFLLVGVGK